MLVISVADHKLQVSADRYCQWPIMGLSNNCCESKDTKYLISGQRTLETTTSGDILSLRLAALLDHAVLKTPRTLI